MTDKTFFGRKARPGRARDLLPVPTEGFEGPDPTEGRVIPVCTYEQPRRNSRGRRHERKQRAIQAAVQGALYALNEMSRGGFCNLHNDFMSRPGKASAGQDKVYELVVKTCNREFSRGLLRGADQWLGCSVKTSLNWQYGTKEQYEGKFMDATKLSLPEDGIAGTVSMVTSLPPILAEKYQQGSELVRDVPESELKRVRSFMGASQAEYRKVVQILINKKIIEMRETKPKVVNGLFSVPKKEKQRLILDARKANLYFTACPEVILPNPGCLVDLLMEGDKLHCGKSDLDSFYHRIAIPEWLQTFFGLPAINWGSKKMWPVYRVLPMGWSHSVFVGQMIHEEMISRVEGYQREDLVLPNAPLSIGRMRYGIYIDDLFVLGNDADEAARMVNKCVRESESSGFPVAETKLVLPPRSMIEILGIEVFDDGVMLPHRGKMKSLLILTEHMIKAPQWAKKTLEEVIGKWIWFLLLRRPLLSTLKASYEMLHAPKYTAIPSFAVRSEFRTLTNIVPLIYGRLDREFADKILCIDASLIGGGVVYTTANAADYKALLGGQYIGEWGLGRPWTTVIKHRWRTRQHINMLEGKALLLGIKWFLRNQNNFGKRLIVGIDNQALIGAVEKGRSSLGLHGICRQIAAWVTAGDLHLKCVYIKSEDNPADGPSRSL